MSKTFLDHVRTEARIAGANIQTNVSAAMELRTSFVLQVIGMMINNIAFLLLWVYFFFAFGNINGWTAIETVGLQGVCAFVYGINFTFMSGSVYLPDFVNNGTFDSLLLSPRNLYVRILTSKIGVSSIGDMLFGVMLMIIYLILSHATFLHIITLIALLPAAVLLIVNVTLVTSLSAFVFPDASAFARNLFEMFFSPSLYPAGLFQGALRFVFIFVVPSLMIAGFPIEVIRDQSWTGFVLIWLIAVVWTVLAIYLLHRAVRRYESGNLTGARV